MKTGHQTSCYRQKVFFDRFFFSHCVFELINTGVNNAKCKQHFTSVKQQHFYQSSGHKSLQSRSPCSIRSPRDQTVFGPWLNWRVWRVFFFSLQNSFYHQSHNNSLNIQTLSFFWLHFWTLKVLHASYFSGSYTLVIFGEQREATAAGYWAPINRVSTV